MILYVMFIIVKLNVPNGTLFSTDVAIYTTAEDCIKAKPKIEKEVKNKYKDGKITLTCVDKEIR